MDHLAELLRFLLALPPAESKALHTLLRRECGGDGCLRQSRIQESDTTKEKRCVWKEGVSKGRWHS